MAADFDRFPGVSRHRGSKSLDWLPIPRGSPTLKIHRCIAMLATILGLGTTSIAGASALPLASNECKNHYILKEPCTQDWTAVSEGLTDLDVRVVAIDPLSKATLYAGGPTGVFKSIDGGGTWRLTGLDMATREEMDTAAALRWGLPASFKASSVVTQVAINPRSPGTLYAATEAKGGATYLQRRLFKSIDGGASWNDSGSPWDNGVDSISSLVIAPSDPATLYLARFDGMGDTAAPVARSTDAGAAWSGTMYVVLKVLAVDPGDSRTIYGGTYDYPSNPWDFFPNGVVRSRDGGASWASTGLTGSGITALAVDPANSRTLYAATFGDFPKGKLFKGVFKSLDAGETWDTSHKGLGTFIGTASTVTALVVDADDSNTIYLGMAGAGIFRSVDAGASWSPFNDGLPNLNIRSLALVAGSPNTLYAGTAEGVFKIVDVLPVLSLDAPSTCLGAPWSVRLRGAQPETPARLRGVRNGQPWESDWLRTNDQGEITDSGRFGVDGAQAFRVELGGVLSNSVRFEVSACGP